MGGDISVVILVGLGTVEMDGWQQRCALETATLR